MITARGGGGGSRRRHQLVSAAASFSSPTGLQTMTNHHRHVRAAAASWVTRPQQQHQQQHQHQEQQHVLGGPPFLSTTTMAIMSALPRQRRRRRHVGHYHHHRLYSSHGSSDSPKSYNNDAQESLSLSSSIENDMYPENVRGEISVTTVTAAAAAAAAAAADDDEAAESQPREQHHQSQRRRRRILLDAQLHELGVDAAALYQAAIISGQEESLSSLSDDTSNDEATPSSSLFGQSALRAYRSFVYPKKEDSNGNDNDDDARLVAMAQRTAQQINFLRKRHLSHQQEWVRHHDTGMGVGIGIFSNNDAAAARSNDSTDTALVSQQELQVHPRTTVFPLILILDNLRSAFNVGSLFRTADATGCTAILTCGITPHPLGNGHAKLSKSALGAERLVPSRHFRTTRQALEHVRECYPQYRILALETTEKSKCYTDVVYPLPASFNEESSDNGQIITASTDGAGVALIFGNEVTGVDVDIMPLVDELVEIPMFGTKNSLNVASCAPIVLYEIIRQWRTTTKDE